VVELPLYASQARLLQSAADTTRSGLLSTSIDILTTGISH
jgi:hypothetical protein